MDLLSPRMYLTGPVEEDVAEASEVEEWRLARDPSNSKFKTTVGAARGGGTQRAPVGCHWTRWRRTSREQGSGGLQAQNVSRGVAARGGRRGMGEGGAGTEGQHEEDNTIWLFNLPTDCWSYQRNLPLLITVYKRQMTFTSPICLLTVGVSLRPLKCPVSHRKHIGRIL